MFRLKAVRQQYSSDKTISFPDWEVEQGAHWLLLGNSGSGKTTLLHILGGLLMPAKGEVTIAGTVVNKLSEQKRDAFRGQHIGIVFQKPHLIETLTVKENLLLAQYFSGKPQSLKRVDEVLASLGIKHLNRNLPNSLSEGEAQRVSIARAIINNPALLLADEPTASLDDINTNKVIELLTSVARSQNATLVIATHDGRVKAAIPQHFKLTAANEPV